MSTSDDQKKADEGVPFKGPNYDNAVDFMALAASNKGIRDCLTDNNGRFDFKNADHLR